METGAEGSRYMRTGPNTTAPSATLLFLPRIYGPRGAPPGATAEEKSVQGLPRVLRCRTPSPGDSCSNHSPPGHPEGQYWDVGEDMGYQEEEKLFKG